MRVICPRCGAQYEIDAAAIPAAGREVECSACNHVWHQPGSFDAAARPTLNRPLHESVLSILREEADRELSARKAQEATWHDPRLAHLPPAPVSAEILADKLAVDDMDLPPRRVPQLEALVVDETADKDSSEHDLPGDENIKSPEIEPVSLTKQAPEEPAKAAAVPLAEEASQAVAPATKPQGGYRIGFLFALMLVGLLIAAYLLAPKVEAGGLGDLLRNYRVHVDSVWHALQTLREGLDQK